MHDQSHKLKRQEPQRLTGLLDLSRFSSEPIWTSPAKVEGFSDRFYESEEQK